jgi:MYXO-CTERM domain-containing protein
MHAIARDRDSFHDEHPAASMRRTEVSRARTGHARPSSTLVRVSATLAALMTSLVAREAGATVTPIDDFEATGAVQAWQFSNGSEFPGAQGSATVAAVNGGNALKLGYDFSKGGLYVAVTRTFSPELDISSLRLKAQVPAAASLALRVEDATGQWLQYTVERPLAPIDPKAWFTSTVDLTSPDSHWSGTDDGVLHRPISAVSLLAQASATHPADAVQVDAMEGLDALTLDLDPANVPTAPPPAGLGHLFDGAGVAVHDLADTAGLDEAARAGFKWARTDLFWDWVETSLGLYDFGGFDTFFAALDARGMKPIFILDHGNSLYCNGPPTTADAQTAFAAYALAAARHFAGRGARFEIWNEPNNASFWPPTPDALAFSTLVQVAASAIHTGDPTAHVITGGLSWFDFDYLGAELHDGAASHADAVGVHPYRGTDPPETLPAHVVEANLAIGDDATLDTALPLWDTEWGYASSQFGAGDSDPARQRQAVFAARRMLAARLVGFPLAVWYDLRDDGTTPDLDEENFGLLTKAGSEKPAYLALQTLNNVTRSRDVLGIVDVAQPLLSGMLLQGAGDRTLALWATSAAQAVTVNVPLPSAAYDVLGNAQPLRTSYTLLEALGPIYLTFDEATVQQGDAGASSEAGGQAGAETSNGGDNGNGGDRSDASEGGRPGVMAASAGTMTLLPQVTAGSAGARGYAGGSGSASTDGPEFTREVIKPKCGCSTASGGGRESSAVGLFALLLTLRRRRRT